MVAAGMIYGIKLRENSCKYARSKLWIKFVEDNIQKVGRKVCTIKYNGAIAKLTAKGIMFLAGGNTPLFFQDAASFAKFVNTALSTRMMRNLGMPRI